MPDLDDELIARAIRWCADAGRHASAAQVRAALAPLSWDQLLQVRALLADPPPSRPLGPWALADLGRGALPETAAERERSGQYAPEDDTASAESGAPPRETPARASSGASRPRGAVAPVIHRARDRVVAETGGVPDRRPLLEALLESEGRSTLERLVRKLGARRAPLLAALAEGWRRADGTAPTGSDLDRLLQAHGLARGFERRERDELLHALRAAGGVLKQAAIRVGTGADELVASLARLGASADAESIRESHRADVRRRATLSERVRQLLADPARLEDLGMLREIEDDLRTRIPEHVRALRASGASPLATALTQTLAMGPRELPVLLDRLGLALDAVPQELRAASSTERRAGRPERPGATPAWTTAAERSGRSTGRPSGRPREAQPRSSGSRFDGRSRGGRTTPARRDATARGSAPPRGPAAGSSGRPRRDRPSPDSRSPRPVRSDAATTTRRPRPSGPRGPKQPRPPSPPRGRGARSK